jgi:hypothetical protein
VSPPGSPDGKRQPGRPPNVAALDPCDPLTGKERADLHLRMAEHAQDGHRRLCAFSSTNDHDEPGGNDRILGSGPESGFEATLGIRPPLSEAVLDCVRPPRPVAPLPGVDWLGAVTVNPAAALADFVTGWYPKTSGASPGASSATELPVPPPLAHFHRLAAERPQILGVQNFIEPWEELARHAGGPLRIAVENQGGWDWRVDPSEPDPAVWIHHDDVNPPEREREPLSAWLLQFALAEAAIGGPYVAFTADRPPTPLVDDLTRRLRRVPLRSYRWSGSPTSFHVAPGLVVKVGGETGDDTYDSVVVGATHRVVLKPLAHVGIEWLRFDG